MSLNLTGFTVPNFVSVQMPARPRGEGMQESPKFALHELDVQTLAGLCDEFRMAVFAKAGKKDPQA